MREGVMKAGLLLAAWAAMAAAGASAAASQAGPGATFTVRNDSEEKLECAIKKVGSSQMEAVFLRPGAEMKREYPKPNARNFRCMGAEPVWYVLQPNLVYRLAKNRNGLIVLTPAAQ
jgi:hypothetical protein